MLASTDPCIVSGQQLQLPDPQLLQVLRHKSQAVVTTFQHQYCIIGASVCRGYREFKTSDGYQDDVIAISIETLGAVDSQRNAIDPHAHAIQACDDGMQGIEMATFYAASQLFALRAESVLEALPASAINPVSAGRMPHCVGTLARYAQGQVTGYVWVFDLAQLLTGQRTRITAQCQVVVIAHGARKLGLLVDALHGVHHFSQASIIAAPSMAANGDLLVAELIKANQGALLVQCLTPPGLLKALQQRPATAPVPATAHTA